MECRACAAWLDTLTPSRTADLSPVLSHSIDSHGNECDGGAVVLLRNHLVQ